MTLSDQRLIEVYSPAFFPLKGMEARRNIRKVVGGKPKKCPPLRTKTSPHGEKAHPLTMRKTSQHGEKVAKRRNFFYILRGGGGGGGERPTFAPPFGRPCQRIT